MDLGFRSTGSSSYVLLAYLVPDSPFPVLFLAVYRSSTRCVGRSAWYPWITNSHDIAQPIEAHSWAVCPFRPHAQQHKTPFYAQGNPALAPKHTSKRRDVDEKAIVKERIPSQRSLNLCHEDKARVRGIIVI